MAALSKTTAYSARVADSDGWVDYSQTEDQTWAHLFSHQKKLICQRACKEFLQGLEILNLPTDRVAQVPEVNRALFAATQWQLQPVAAVIPFAEFFELLSQRKFPAATFIRRPEDIEYLQEPDIFHEIYGHCPMLTNPVFADFVQAYGKLGLAATPKERVYLARLFWFSVEFGLINTHEGLRTYGAGILSSTSECCYALENYAVERRPWGVMNVLRTPYRIDIMQPIYYVIDSYEQLYAAMDSAVMRQIHTAMQIGLFPPTYTPPKNSTVAIPVKHDC
ncbi:MAG: phenylalanine 4-monooxygenase [Xanthomonadales bacterium]|nr:phenylalanine 4-monooxygenase [Xanthomonadales bacterium]